MKKKGIRKMKFVIQRVTHAEVEVEQKIIGSEKTEMIHQNKKECSCALALLQERTYLLRTY